MINWTHSFRGMNHDSYRIAYGDMAFTDALPKEYQVVRTRSLVNHQATTQQFFQPAILYGFNKNYYVTTNEMQGHSTD